MQKTFSICTSRKSEYQNFNGMYPSGKNWFDYIEWVCIEMNKFIGSENNVILDNSDAINLCQSTQTINDKNDDTHEVDIAEDDN